MYHLQNLPKNKLDKLFSDSVKYFITTEKIDGSSFSYGINELQQVYIKTKTNTWYFPFQISDSVLMKEIKRVASDLLSQRWVLKNLFWFTGPIEITGELVPVHDWNTVIYPKELVKDGMFTIFSTNYNSSTVVTKEKIVQMLSEAFPEYNFNYSCPSTYISNIIDEEITLFGKQNCETIKQMVVRGSDTIDFRKQLQKLTKQILKKIWCSTDLGYKPEGYVSEVTYLTDKGPNSFLFKLVDTDEFTENNRKNWIKIAELNKLKDQLERCEYPALKPLIRKQANFQCQESEFPNYRKFVETLEYYTEILKL